MGVELNQKTYRKLIEEDIAWLDTMPNCLERVHIKDVLRKAANIPSIHNKIEEERLDAITKRIFDYWCDIPPLEKGTILCIFGNKDTRAEVSKRFSTLPTTLEKSEVCMTTDGYRTVIFYCPCVERIALCDHIKQAVFVSCCRETVSMMADALKYSFEDVHQLSFINL